MTRVKTYTRHTHVAELGGGIEVELTHKPCEWTDMLHERVGDKLVVAYLVHDDDGYSANPMENRDCNGNVWTRGSNYARDSKITDNNGELYGALGLDIYGGVDIDRLFDCEPYIDDNGLQKTKNTLRDMAADQFMEKFKVEEGLRQKWVEYTEGDDLVEGQDYEIILADVDHDLVDPNGCFWEEIEKLALDLYPEHWQKIAGPYVVPISYHAERGGYSIFATTWDGDPDDLPDGVWVACKCAEENIVAGAMAPGYEVGQIKGDDGKYTPEYGLTKDGVQIHRGTHGACWDRARELEPVTDADLHRRAFEYADGIVREYASWAEGDVYGCVVEIFDLVYPGLLPVGHDDRPDEWEQIDEDACWGYLQSDYALTQLRDEHFTPTVERLRATFEADGP